MIKKKADGIEKTLSALADLGEIKNESQLESAMAQLAQRRQRVLNGLAITTENPAIQSTIDDADQRLRIDDGHPLLSAVNDLLDSLPESEWFIDESGNKMFLHDDGAWAALVDVSRLPFTSPTELAEKQLNIVRAKAKFREFIERHYRTPSDQSRLEKLIGMLSFRPKAPRKAAQDTMSDDTKRKKPKRKRGLNQHAKKCIKEYKAARRRDDPQPMKAIVNAYVFENPGVSADYTMRILNDHSDRWKDR